MNILRDLLKAHTPWLLAIGFLVILAFGAWQWVSSWGYKVQALALSADLAQVQEELTGCKGTAASRLVQIEAQNASIEEARVQGELRHRAALQARDEALRRARETDIRYARLKESWPQDAVSAVQRVRQEYGL